MKFLMNIFVSIVFLCQTASAGQCERYFRSEGLSADVSILLKEISSKSKADVYSYQHQSGKTISILFDPDSITVTPKSTGEQIKIAMGRNVEESMSNYDKTPFGLETYSYLRSRFEKINDHVPIFVLDPYALAYYENAKTYSQYSLAEMAEQLRLESRTQGLKEHKNSLLKKHAEILTQKRKPTRLFKGFKHMVFLVPMSLTLLPISSEAMLSLMFSFIGASAHVLFKIIKKDIKELETQQFHTSTAYIDTLLQNLDHVVLILPEDLKVSLVKGFSENSEFTQVEIP